MHVYGDTHPFFQHEILQATYLLKFRHLIFSDTMYQMSDFFQIKLNIKKKSFIIGYYT